MQKILTAVGSAAMILSSFIPVSFAATMMKNVPKEEPVSGFTRGRDPEWNEMHLTQPTPAQNHREYHKDKIETHLKWHDDWKAKVGSGEFMIEHRKFHEQMNLSHRKFHNDLTGEKPTVRPRSTTHKPVERLSRRFLRKMINR